MLLYGNKKKGVRKMIDKRKVLKIVKEKEMIRGYNTYINTIIDNRNIKISVEIIDNNIIVSANEDIKNGIYFANAIKFSMY